MASLWKDFRYGFRVLRKTLGFTLIAVLTIALGVAATTTIFSWINAVLLNPLPGTPEPGRVVAMETVSFGASGGCTYMTSGRNSTSTCLATYLRSRCQT